MTQYIARALRIARHVAQHAGRAAINAVLPPTCLVSDAPVDAPGRLTPQAWRALTFLADPACALCGVPFAFDLDHALGPDANASSTLCGACAAAPPAYDRARAALLYDDASRPLVLALKHGARADGVETFAGWMAGVLTPEMRARAIVAPVPLHASRLRQRRFNQSALLARALAERIGRPFDPDSLARVRATASQAGKSASGRARNVAGAFQMRAGRADVMAGAHVLLVDDVHTTGATLQACARVLKRAGAERVEAVTLARVVRARDALI